MRQAVESPQWNLPFTACTSVSMDTVVVLASSLQAWRDDINQGIHQCTDLGNKITVCIHIALGSLSCSPGSMACSMMRLDWRASCACACGRGKKLTSCA